MSVTLASLRELVRQRLGVASHDSFFDDSLLDANINLALFAVEGEHRWPWNERIDQAVVTDGLFDLPDDYRATRALYYDQTELLEMAPYELFTRFASPVSAYPTHYATIDQVGYVRPIPTDGTVVNHLYYASPSELVNDSDQPRIPIEHIGTVVAKAAQLCSVREDDRPSADSHLTEYMTGIARMRKDVRGIMRPVVPRTRPGSWLGG